jgi:hypothetical protein
MHLQPSNVLDRILWRLSRVDEGRLLAHHVDPGLIERALSKGNRTILPNREDSRP